MSQEPLSWYKPNERGVILRPFYAIGWVEHEWLCPLDQNTCHIRYWNGAAQKCRYGEVYFWGCQVDVREREKSEPRRER